MSALEKIEVAVARLPNDNLAQFRAWFEAFDAAQSDRQIERDAEGGKFDNLTDQELADYQQGRAR